MRPLTQYLIEVDGKVVAIRDTHAEAEITRQQYGIIYPYQRITLSSITDGVVTPCEEQAEASPMGRFGAYVYGLLDGAEWSSDQMDAIADYAAYNLGRPFTSPEDAAEPTKTPEQVAEEVTALRTGPSGGFSMPDRREFAEMVATAIRRDREQREETGA